MMLTTTLLAGLTFEPTITGGWTWVGIAAAIMIVCLAYTMGLRWRGQSRAFRFTLLGLRLGAIACLLMALVHPVWVDVRERPVKPSLAVVLDTSTSMAKGDRYAANLALLREQLAPALESDYDLHLYDIHGRALAVDDLPAAPNDTASPIIKTLLHVERALAESHPAGIVLLSDGIDATNRPAPGSVDDLQLPLFAVAPAESSATQTAADLAIHAVSANRHALVGNTVNVTVDMTSDAPFTEAVGVPVTILHGSRIVGSRTIAWPVGQTAQRAELNFIPNRPGRLTYTVRIGAAEGEADLADNVAHFDLTVRARALTVVYIDGVLRWEGKFIREALADDPDINVVSSIRTARAGSDRPSQGLLLAEQLADVDVVMLGDIEATWFSAAEQRDLAAWVREGGGLVLTGGYNSFGPAGFGRSSLRNVLPIEFSAEANPQIEQPFNLKLTLLGREHPIFHLTGDRVRDAAFYQSLPALLGCSRIAAVKPAAQILAVNPSMRTADGGVGLPVMVEQELGAGRSMIFAVDSTWRWRMVVGAFTGDAGFYQRFWGQLVRYMAGEDQADEPLLALATDRHHYARGDTIELTANITDQANWQVSATAIDERGRSVDVPLTQRGDERYEARLAANRPGRLDLVVEASPGNAGDVLPQSRVISVRVDRDDIESLDTQPRRQWLAQLAQRTGGRLLDADEAAAWARSRDPQPYTEQVAGTERLWRHPALAGAFFVLLCIEWILRRRSRLA